jgi:hypothetical protein
VEKKERPEQAFPQTLGAKLFSFGRHKIASLMKTVQRISRRESAIPGFRTSGRLNAQVKPSPKAHLPIVYKTLPVIASFARDSKKSIAYHLSTPFAEFENSKTPKRETSGTGRNNPIPHAAEPVFKLDENKTAGGAAASG